MIIYFLRHASAGESLDDPKKDEARGLDKEGIRQCTYVGKALAALDVSVDVIATSPLKRATQTASLVGNEIGFEGKLHKEDALRPEGTLPSVHRPDREVSPPRGHHDRGAQSQRDELSGPYYLAQRQSSHRFQKRRCSEGSRRIAGRTTPLDADSKSRAHSLRDFC